MSKISTYAIQAIVKATDYLLGDDSTGPTTKRFLLSDILTYILNNIPATEGSLAFVSSGLVWSGDAYASTRAASMTSGRIRVNTTFLAIAAVTARVFTASKDTYIDVLDNLDGTGTLVYTEVANNAASPALAANSVRIGIIVTGASNIASAGSINQGQEDRVLPVASSTNYSVTDSLGNLICPRDPNRNTLGARLATGALNSLGTTPTLMPGLSMTVNIPTGRKVDLIVYIPIVQMSVAGAVTVSLYNSATVTGTAVQQSTLYMTTSGTGNTQQLSFPVTLSGTQSFCVGIAASTAGSGTISANGASTVNYLKARLA